MTSDITNRSPASLSTNVWGCLPKKFTIMVSLADDSPKDVASSYQTHCGHRKRCNEGDSEQLPSEETDLLS